MEPKRAWLVVHCRARRPKLNADKLRSSPPHARHPRPESGGRHVMRGASWARASRSELRLAYRNAGRDGNLEIGFRIARYVDKPDIESGE